MFSPWKNLLDTRLNTPYCTCWVKCQSNKHGEPVIASNINVFCFINTNKIVSIYAHHFTTINCMLIKVNKWKRKCLISNKFLHLLALQIQLKMWCSYYTFRVYRWQHHGHFMGESSRWRTNENASFYLHCVYQILART